MKIGHDIDDLASREYAPLTYVLDPWLTLPSLSILWAWRGVGKTWVALSIAHAAATAGEFLGWKAPKAYRVVYIDGELGARTVVERMFRVDASAKQSVVGKNLRVVTYEDAPNKIIWNLAHPAEQSTYTKIVEDADLIVIDNIATTVRQAGRGLQTDVETWASVQSWAIARRSEGKSILFIDHAAKAGHQRGTSTKEDVVDTIISLTRDSEYDPSFGCEFNLRFEKARHFHGESAQSLRVSLRDSHEGTLAWHWSPLRNHIEAKVVSLLRKKRSIPEILSAVPVTRNRIAEIKAKLKDGEEEFGGGTGRKDIGDAF